MKKDICLFCTGGTIYPLLEIASRGRTDFSMALAGGVCLCLIDRICCKKMKGRSPVLRCLAGSGIITTVEFCTGLIVNILLKMDVWDYSALPVNIMGQICLRFSVIWCFLTIPAMSVCTLFDKSKLLTKKHAIFHRHS